VSATKVHEPAVEEDVEQRERRENGPFARVRRAVSLSGASLTALIALISAGVALFFQLRPDLLPDPRTHRSASLKVFAVDDGVKLGQFLHRRKAIVTPAEYAKERAVYIGRSGGPSALNVLRTPGLDVFVRAHVEGFKSRSVALVASMYDADRHRRVPELDDVPVFQQHVDAPSDDSVIEFWMSAPPVTVNRYFVRVAMYHRGDGVLLAIVDSPRVRVAGAPPPPRRR
jgi:hypothetical protein